MSELPIKITLKSGAGYDAPWVTVDAADPADASFKLDAILEGDLAEKVISVANLLKAANNAAPLVQGGEAAAQAAPPQQNNGWSNSPAAAAPAWAGAPQQAAPAAAPGVVLHPLAIKCPSCGSAVQEKVINSKKTGKTFKLWVCPSQRSQGDGHYSEFQD